MKKKLSLIILMAVMCFTVLAGCGTNQNNNNNNNETTNQGLQEPSSNNNATDATTDDANVSGNDGSNTTGAGNEGSVTTTNGSSEGVIDEIATDIGNGLEDLGNDMNGNENSNVNDVTSGRQ